MAIQIKHQFVSLKGDGSDLTQVQPSNWNDTHEINQASGTVLGRATVGAGPTEEIPWTAFGRAFINAADQSAAQGILGPVTTLANQSVSYKALQLASGPGKLIGSNGNPALTITGAANNGAGLIRLTVASTSTFTTGQRKVVAGVVGTTEANDSWLITVVDATHIDLQGSVFTNAYVSGGTIGGGYEEISLGAGLSMVGPSLTASQDIQGGRLTLTTAVPVLGAQVLNATSVFWTPDQNNQITLYNGVSWVGISSPEVSIKTTDVQNGATHSGTRVIDQLTDTSKLMVGMEITGTGVGVGSVIQSIDSPTQITGSVNSTITDYPIAITFKVPADKAVDIFGKLVGGALVLRGVFRSALLTPNAMDKQDGVDVLASDHTLRWLGSVVTSATAGQIDWVLKGFRRFRVWNRNNKRTRHNNEVFVTAGTWGAAIGCVSLEVEVAGGGAGSTGNATAASFGALAAANGGTTASHGIGTVGDYLFSGTGGYATSGNGTGGRAITLVDGKAQPATAAVAVGSAGGGGGQPGWVYAREVVEF